MDIHFFIHFLTKISLIVIIECYTVYSLLMRLIHLSVIVDSCCVCTTVVLFGVARLHVIILGLQCMIILVILKWNL